MNAARGDSPKKGLAAVIPVVGGLAVISALAVVVMLREPTRVRGAPAPEAPPRAATEVPSSTPQPTALPPPPPSTPALSASVEAAPKPADPAPPSEEQATIERLADALEQEIKDAERAGRTDEAAEKRIRVSRLRAHIAEARKALDEKREPQ